MATPFEPFDPPESERRTSNRSARISQLLNSPISRKTPMGNDTAWALKLKEAVDTAARNLHVRVLSAKPVCAESTPADGNMRFELDTDKGRLFAMRHPSGQFTFTWL